MSPLTILFFGCSAKDSLMGKAKAVVGGLTGNENMKERGQAQESHGDNKQVHALKHSCLLPAPILHQRHAPMRFVGAADVAARVCVSRQSYHSWTLGQLTCAVLQDAHHGAS